MRWKLCSDYPISLGLAGKLSGIDMGDGFLNTGSIRPLAAAASWEGISLSDQKLFKVSTEGIKV